MRFLLLIFMGRLQRIISSMVGEVVTAHVESDVLDSGATYH